MAEGLLLNIAEDLLKKIASKSVDEIALAWGFKSHVERLQNTINTLKNILMDAEQKQQHNLAIQGWLGRLKEVVYEADDLFDEVATMASRKEVIGGSKFTREVKTFFSSSNQPHFAFSVSQKVKKIREKLDEIEADGNIFKFVQYSCAEPRVEPKYRDETHSFVDAQEVIGRDHDKKAIFGIFDQYQDHVHVVPIVGIGGLGKTTLAQLVYSDDRVDKLFDLKLWVCVSDNFDIKEIVRSILMSATHTEPQNLRLDQLKEQMQDQIVGKKYLLVLDDVCNEDREKWLKLSDLLNIGGQGSKILVTTRSWRVAGVMGTIENPYALEGLQKESSWSLFKKMALKPGQEHNNLELLQIGREIVEKCGNNPLTIRVLGCLLYGKDESKWLSFKEKSLAHISGGENDVIKILKLSYDHLWSSLKSCFAYCARFPKDYKFDKEKLISLWMAQGFVSPVDGSQSLEEAGEEYFTTLLKRCFFQEVIRDDYEWGNIKTIKMHDLIHDLAIKVAGIECKLAKQEETQFDKRICHMSFDYRLTSSWNMPSNALKLPLLRTFVLPNQVQDGSILSKSILRQLLASCRCLRVLDLHELGVTSLPSSIGKLIHLRYLNLSKTPIERLPNSITELLNLQTLDLSECEKLTSLPADIFKRLTNLRSLDLLREYLTMFPLPSGIGQLTLLHKLTYFPVFVHEDSVKLSDLKNLNKLKGSLRIELGGGLKEPIHEAKEANLGSKSGLEVLEIIFNPDMDSENCEVLMEGLKPHHNLKKLAIQCYSGKKLLGLAQMDNLCTSLPNLVDIFLFYLPNCQKVPRFSKLPLLRCLRLYDLPKLEYMESGDTLSEICISQQEPLFFPSLHQLVLCRMDNFQGWWKELGVVVDEKKSLSVELTKLNYLSKLEIYDCPKLRWMPLCPNVEELSLVNVNATLSVVNMASSIVSSVNAATMSTVMPSSSSNSKLKSLRIGNVEKLMFLPKECLHNLSSLSISRSTLLSISELEEVLKSLYSLRSLELHSCDNLRSLFGGLEHLSTLENLVIGYCDKLDLVANEEMEGRMPWKALYNLRSLELKGLDELVALPIGLRHLTNLCSLKLSWNFKLKELPEWIKCLSSLEQKVLQNCRELISLPVGFQELTSLKKLEVRQCEISKKRCIGPAGQDWRKIQHIPLPIFRD